METTINIYIGSNPKAEYVDTSVIESVVNQYRFSGYTIVPCTGHWHGTKEESVILIICGDYEKIMMLIDELLEELEQDAIGYQVANNIMLRK